MARTLHSEAVLTAAQAALWDEVWRTAFAARHANVGNEGALEALIESTRQGVTVADLLGDGRRKVPELCAMPHGLVPPALARRPGELRGKPKQHDKRPPATRVHATAVARVPEMIEIDERVGNRVPLRRARDRAFLDLNRLTFELLYPATPKIPNGRAVDVPGDGRIKPFSDIKWPPGIQIMQHRGVRTTG